MEGREAQTEAQTVGVQQRKPRVVLREEAYQVECLPPNMTNLDRFRNDLERLVKTGQLLDTGIKYECYPNVVISELKQHVNPRTKAYKTALKTIPSFKNDYQRWYSEAQAVIKQLLPDRLADFVHYYDRGPRKEITFATYSIKDYLQGLRVTRTHGAMEDVLVQPSAAIPLFEQQLAILKSAEAQFESTLFHIRELVQADLFDSELDAAEELRKKGFFRAAGAVAGVVLEGHLEQVCINHKVPIPSKDPTINYLNDLLRNAGVIETPEWRSIQHLADIRNKCDHKKQVEPTGAEIDDLIAGVKKKIKNLF